MNASEREGECVLAMYSKCVFRWKRLLTVQEVVYSTWHWIMDDMQMSTPDSWRFKGTKGFLNFWWWHSTNWGRCCFLSIQSNTRTQRERVTDKWLIKNIIEVNEKTISCLLEKEVCWSAESPYWSILFPNRFHLCQQRGHTKQARQFVYRSKQMTFHFWLYE